MAKRQATTDLNHDNWDKDDPADHEEMGTYKLADRDILEKRVIRTAKRRNPMSSGDEVKKSVFSGFGGFNKAQPSSFDFLANLTNGNKTNGSATSNNETPLSNSVFQNKPIGDSKASSGFFSIPVTTTFGSQSSPAKPLFGVASPTASSTSLFTASKVDTNIATPNKTSGSTELPSGGFSFKANTNPMMQSQTASVFGTPSTTTASVFGTPSTTTNISMASATFTSVNSSKMQSVSTTTASNKIDVESSGMDKKNNKESKKLAYYAKLKGLNESVSDWIKKHVEETPLCILTPIFKDYENHLKVIQEEYNSEDDMKIDDDTKITSLSSKNSSVSVTDSTTPIKNSSSTLFSATTSNSSTSLTVKSTQDETATSSPFSFGINTTPKTSTPPSTGFSFGVNKTTSPVETKPASSPFSFANNTGTTNPTAPSPFSFGIGQKFSFSPKTVQSEASEETPANEEDQPPKVEFTPVVEDNSVFEKRCKVFVKKDDNFADKGVGTLYIKKIEDSGKHQLIVRANTNLGTVLVNLILASAIPTQRMGKNNVMLVCIPTPDAKPPPTPILIRVKTSEEADELLETLNKYKA